MMQKWMRRVRAGLAVGFTWAIAWAAVGSLPRLLFGFKSDAPFPIVFGALGFAAGIAFSGLVVLSERRRRIDQISLTRFAGLGAAGGLLLSAGFAKAASLSWGDIVIVAPTFALASAVCAAGSLALARRALQRESAEAENTHREPPV